MSAYSRRATDHEWDLASNYLASMDSQGVERKQILDDLLWTVINSQEFPSQSLGIQHTMKIYPAELSCSPSRRDFIRIGMASLGGLSLASLLRQQSALGSNKRDLNCIVLFQAGGNSQIDTWDPKPDAEAEIRGYFKAIPTVIPGIHFSELLPESAKRLSTSTR